METHGPGHVLLFAYRANRCKAAKPLGTKMKVRLFLDVCHRRSFTSWHSRPLRKPVLACLQATLDQNDVLSCERKRFPTHFEIISGRPEELHEAAFGMPRDPLQNIRDLVRQNNWSLAVGIFR